MALETRALTRLTTVKDELGITDSSKDARLERMIHAATDLAESECGRVFVYGASITEKVRGFGTPQVVVARTPIVTITSVTELGTLLTASDYESLVDQQSGRADSGIILRKGGTTVLGQWPWTAMRRPDIVQDLQPGTEALGITVVYAGGFVTPEQAAQSGGSLTRSLPYDLEQAAIEIVVSLFRQAGEDRNVTLEAVTDAQQSWGRGRDLVPEAARSLLSRYRRIAGA